MQRKQFKVIHLLRDVKCREEAIKHHENTLRALEEEMRLEWAKKADVVDGYLQINIKATKRHIRKLLARQFRFELSRRHLWQKPLITKNWKLVLP